MRRTVDIDDVRAPSAVAEVDEVTDVGTPDWLRDQPGRDSDDDVPGGRFGGARVDPGRRGALTLAVVGLIAVVVTAFVVIRQRPVSSPVPPLASVQTTTVGPGVPSTVAQQAEAGVSAQVDPDAPGEIVVSVVGLVHRGGLVRLPPGARVADAVAAAGGAREGADLTGINLAQRVRDGDQILVGAAQQDGSPQLGSVTVSGSGTGHGAADTTPENGPSGTVDLNVATEAQLDALPGVGPVTARAIMNWRNANGRFTSVDQLAEVDGIGPARLARLRDLVTV
ncbi:ComEA family DNA-binding protein [Nocardia shimofusensis]|uniref:ComEA family DNA-binding protein n=1 Tax=Nocardia shimofusensis TaxID=228596 RepID=UPI001FE0C993|nr:helix-hairpin-helix domain-containing protein [Nocardia shimofusensis]